MKKILILTLVAIFYSCDGSAQKKETKQNTVLSTIGGTSDARFIKDIAPCIEFGLVGNTMHQVDERSSIKDMKKLKSIYLQIIKSFFNQTIFAFDWRFNFK